MKTVKKEKPLEGRHPYLCPCEHCRKMRAWHWVWRYQAARKAARARKREAFTAGKSEP